MERINNNIPYTVLLIFSISVHKKFEKKGKKRFYWLGCIAMACKRTGV